MEIPKEELRELYNKQKLSSPAISKIYSIRPEKIRRLLRKYRIRIRTKSEATKLRIGVNIPKRKLENLYIKQEFSADQIAKKINCSPSLIRKRLGEFQIQSRTLHEAKSVAKPKYPRKNFSGNLKEKAYLIGFRLGDLHVKKRGQFSPTVIINTTSTKAEQIELVQKLFSRYGHIWISKPDINKATSIRCFVNYSFDFLLPKKDKIESWILTNNNYFSAFLAGYIDAEGTFCICGTDGVFHIRSGDKNIIWQIWKNLINLNILCAKPKLVRRKDSVDYRGIKSNNDVWMLTIYRKESLLRLANLIAQYLKHPLRISGMNKVKKNINDRNKNYHNKSDKRWLKIYTKEYCEWA